MVDLWRDLWISETGTGQQVAQLHDIYNDDDDHDDDDDILSRQPTPVIFRTCSNLVHFTQSNAFYPSMKQANKSSSTTNVRSDIILSIPAAYLFLFPLLHSYWFSPGTSLISFSVTFLCIRNIIFAVYAKMTIVWLRKLNWTECGRTRLWPVLEYYTVIVCRDWGKMRNLSQDSQFESRMYLQKREGEMRTCPSRSDIWCVTVDDRMWLV